MTDTEPFTRTIGDDDAEYLIELAQGSMAIAVEEGDDFTHRVIGWKYEAPMLQVTLQGAGGPREVVRILEGMWALEVDSVSVIFDSVKSSAATGFKSDGSTWDIGEMQAALDDPNHPDHDDVFEGVMIHHCQRKGAGEQFMLPYTWSTDTEGKPTLVWGDQGDWAPMEEGLISRAMARLSAMEPMINYLRDRPEWQELLDRSEREKGEALTDYQIWAITAATLIKREWMHMGVMVAVAAREPEDAEYLVEQLSRIGDGTRVMVKRPGEDLKEVTPPTPPGCHAEDHPLAGQVVTAHPVAEERTLVDGAQFRIKNWVDRMEDPPVFWVEQMMTGRGGFAMKNFLARLQEMAKGTPDGQPPLPTDNNMIYGHVETPDHKHGLGYIVHETELEVEPTT